MIRSLLVAAGLFLAPLLLPAPAQAAYCWCHPLYPGNPGACGTVWVVWQGGLIGFTEVFRGSPPPDEWVAQSLLPPICPEPSCTFRLLLDDGHGCSATPPLATPIATRWKTHDQVVKWQKKAAEIRRQLVQSRGFMTYYCTQAQGLPHVKGMCFLFTKIVLALTIDLVAYVAATMDPPNMDYAVIPAMCTQSAGPPLTMADITVPGGAAFVTAPQLAAVNAWLAKRLEVDNIHCQMVDTWERTSGAILALQAGDAAAEPWIGDLARRYDALKATVITAASQERALRTTALAPFPSEPVPAACPEPTAYEQVILAAAAAGMDLYQARQAAALMAGPCVPAATWPAFLFADVADEVALYADFATVSLAATVCAHTGICAPPVPTLTVTSPNGGGTLTTGQVVPITWTSTGVTGTVRIKLARDGKNFTELIHASAPNTGRYAWKVTGPFTTAARVWIRSNTSPAAVDASNGVSTINGLIVLWPNGGNKLTSGTTKTITWSSSGCVGPVDIKIGRNGVWARAFSDYVPNTGSKSWVVSGPASTQARVRIRCTTAPLLIDTSDAVFTIQ